MSIVTNTQLVFGTVKVWLRVLTAAINEGAATSCFLNAPRSANTVDKVYCWNEEQYVNVDEESSDSDDSDSDTDTDEEDFSSSDSDGGDEAEEKEEDTPGDGFGDSHV